MYYLCIQISGGGGLDVPLFYFCMIEKKVVEEIVEDYLKNSDNYPVDIIIKPGNLITVEIDNDESVSIDDCIALSKHIESRLDREAEDYELEVGSSGIDRPFKALRQYRKNIGNEVEALTKKGSKHAGILKSVDDRGIILTVEKQIKPEGAKRKISIEEDLSFLYDELKYTKYLIRFK